MHKYTCLCTNDQSFKTITLRGYTNIPMIAKKKKKEFWRPHLEPDLPTFTHVFSYFLTVIESLLHTEYLK